MKNSLHIEALGHLLAWYRNDLAYFEQFQRYKNFEFKPEQYCEIWPGSFQKFVNEFRVARNFKEGQTEKLLEICMEWHNKGQWKQVNLLAEEIQRAGISYGLPISLASKVMFLMRPDLILPYDSQAKKALGIKSNVKDYDVFFQLALNQESKNLSKLGECLAIASDLLDVLEANYQHLDFKFQDVRRLRLLDKFLWASGSK